MDFTPLWWLHTQFGILVFSMFFLTWALVIVNLFLLMLALVKRVFRRRPVEPAVSVHDIENIGKPNSVAAAKKTTRKKLASKPPISE